MRDIIKIITKEIITTPYITSKEIEEMVERAYEEGFSDGCAESEIEYQEASDAWR